MAKRPEPVPDLDWDPARARELGAQVVELWTELLARLPDLPVGRDFTTQTVREELDLDVPEEGLSNAELVGRLRPLVFDQSIYPGHPGFFAYISGAGTVPGAAADLIASALNQNLSGFRLSPGANQVRPP
jgi:aromatic-L-amino-acid/L-tryptophan decarboxylase